MSQTPPPAPDYSPGILSLLPLLYVAWADRTLSPSEVSLLKAQAAKLPHLDASDKRILAEWSRPDRPPGRELFQHWRTLLHRHAGELPEDARKNLTELGVAMARRSAEQRTDGRAPLIRPEAVESIRDMESALGDVDEATYQSLFPSTEVEALDAPDYTFNVSAMTALLDDDYAELRQRMRRLLSDPEFAYQELRIKEDYRARVFKWTRLLAEQNLGNLAFPEAYGGEDDMGKYAAVFEMLGYHDLSLCIKFGVQFGLFGGSIANLGTQKHHDRYLTDAGTLALAGCFAMTETGHGSNVRGLETTATYDPATDELVVHSPHWGAGKEYIGNAMDSKLASVFCQLIVGEENHGVHAVLVPLRDAQHRPLPGVTVVDSGYKLGLNGVDNGRIWFDQVRVPRENLLDKYGQIDAGGKYSSPIKNPSKRFFTMLGTLVGGRVCVPRAGLSAAKSGLAIAVNYALRRRQFAAAPSLPETLLLDYPTHQRRLMPYLAKAYAIDFALDWLTQQYVDRTPDTMRALESWAAGLKAYATWNTTATLQECREACGGKGYLSVNRLGDLKADTEIFTTFEGDNNVLCQLVARSLLTKFKQEFNEEGIFGVLRFVGGRIGSQFSELSPLAVRNTDPAHLRDTEFHLTAFRFREERLLYSVAMRLRRKIKGGTKSYDAYLQVQTQLVALAIAYVERLVLEQFQQKVAAETDEELRAVLATLCQLFALHTIESHKGWYFEYDFLSAAKSKAIRREVDRLCAETRLHAAGLVDAFAIPDALLAAPIAT